MSLSSSSPLDALSLSPPPSDQLASQLAAALASDARSDQVNSAKLRSVGQLHDYDQFKGMVAGAHLHGMDLTHQPLDSIAAGRNKAVVREEGAAGGQMRALEAGMGRLSAKEQRDNTARQQELLAETQRNVSAHKQPPTAHDFKRDWRRLGGVDKPTETRHEYLLALDTDRLPTLMKGGVGLEVLGEMIDTLDARRGECAGSDAEAVFGLLASLSSVDRFPMTVAFLSAAQKQRTAALLSWLQQQAPTAATTARPAAVVEEAKEQLTASSDVQPAAAAVTAPRSSSVLTSPPTSASTSISSQPRSRLPLQLPSASISSTYPMLVPGWSSFSSPTRGASSSPSSSTGAVQASVQRTSSLTAVRVSRLAFDVSGVKELLQRFKLSDE